MTDRSEELARRGSLVRSTWLALLEPKRLLPVLVMSAALVAAQGSFSRDPLAVPLGIALCAPVSWRVSFPEGLDLGHGGVRIVLYAAVGTGVVLVLGGVVPRALGMGWTLLTTPSSLLVATALFLVGGWGLGRDIDMTARLRRAEHRAHLLEREAEHAQLLALRAHLDPHFLFNTLNAIAEWCRADGEVAERAVLDLSAMLRAMLAGVKAPSWSLAEELRLVDALFELHRLRDPDLFRFVRRVPVPPPDVMLPSLLLLPLAENAMKHGPGAGHRGDIVLAVTVDETTGRLTIALENPGPFTGRREGGEGLPTIEHRLVLAYGGDATLTIGGVADRTVAEISLPLSGPTARVRREVAA